MILLYSQQPSKIKSKISCRNYSSDLKGIKIEHNTCFGLRRCFRLVGSTLPIRENNVILSPYFWIVMARRKQGAEKDRISSLIRASCIQIKADIESLSIGRREIYSKFSFTHKVASHQKRYITTLPPLQANSCSILVGSNESPCFLLCSCSIRLSAFLLIFLLRLWARSYPLLLAQRLAFSHLLTVRISSSSCRASRFSLLNRMFSLKTVIIWQSLEPATSQLRQASNPWMSSSAVMV